MFLEVFPMGLQITLLGLLNTWPVRIESPLNWGCFMLVFGAVLGS